MGSEAGGLHGGSGKKIRRQVGWVPDSGLRIRLPRGHGWEALLNLRALAGGIEKRRRANSSNLVVDAFFTPLKLWYATEEIWRG